MKTESEIIDDLNTVNVIQWVIRKIQNGDPLAHGKALLKELRRKWANAD